MFECLHVEVKIVAYTAVVAMKVFEKYIVSIHLFKLINGKFTVTTMVKCFEAPIDFNRNSLQREIMRNPLLPSTTLQNASV